MSDSPRELPNRDPSPIEQLEQRLLNGHIKLRDCPIRMYDHIQNEYLKYRLLRDVSTTSPVFQNAQLDFERAMAKDKVAILLDWMGSDAKQGHWTSITRLRRSNQNPTETHTSPTAPVSHMIPVSRTAETHPMPSTFKNTTNPNLTPKSKYPAHIPITATIYPNTPLSAELRRIATTQLSTTTHRSDDILMSNTPQPKPITQVNIRNPPEQLNLIHAGLPHERKLRNLNAHHAITTTDHSQGQPLPQTTPADPINIPELYTIRGTDQLATRQETKNSCQENKVKQQRLEQPHHRIQYIRVVREHPQKHLHLPHTTCHNGTNDVPSTSITPVTIHSPATRQQREAYPDTEEREYNWQTLRRSMIQDEERRIRQIQQTERNLRQHQHGYPYSQPMDSEEDAISEEFE